MKKRFHQRIVLILACIVTFCVTYALILPAITLSRQSTCGMEEHQHTRECYDAEGNLICEITEHRHVDSCFEEGDSPELADENSSLIPDGTQVQIMKAKTEDERVANTQYAINIEVVFSGLPGSEIDSLVKKSDSSLSDPGYKFHLEEKDTSYNAFDYYLSGGKKAQTDEGNTVFSWKEMYLPFIKDTGELQGTYTFTEYKYLLDNYANTEVTMVIKKENGKEIPLAVTTDGNAGTATAQVSGLASGDTLVVTNCYSKVSLKIKTVDKNKNPLSGTELALYREDNKIAEAAANENGEIDFIDLPLSLGTYTMRETKGPDGYVRNQIVWKVTVERNSAAEGSGAGTTIVRISDSDEQQGEICYQDGVIIPYEIMHTSVEGTVKIQKVFSGLSNDEITALIQKSEDNPDSGYFIQIEQTGETRKLYLSKAKKSEDGGVNTFTWDVPGLALVDSEGTSVKYTVTENHYLLENYQMPEVTAVINGKDNIKVTQDGNKGIATMEETSFSLESIDTLMIANHYRSYDSVCITANFLGMTDWSFGNLQSNSESYIEFTSANESKKLKFKEAEVSNHTLKWYVNDLKASEQTGEPIQYTITEYLFSSYSNPIDEPMVIEAELNCPTKQSIQKIAVRRSATDNKAVLKDKVSFCSGEMDSLNIINRYESCFDLQLQVVDEDTKEALKGLTARFKLTMKNDENTYFATNMDSNGIVSFNDLKKGTYTLKVIETADGYKKNTTSWTVIISDEIVDGFKRARIKIKIGDGEEQICYDEGSIIPYEVSFKSILTKGNVTIQKVFSGLSREEILDLVKSSTSSSESGYYITLKSNVGSRTLYLSEAGKSEEGNVTTFTWNVEKLPLLYADGKQIKYTITERNYFLDKYATVVTALDGNSANVPVTVTDDQYGTAMLESFNLSNNDIVKITNNYIGYTLQIKASGQNASYPLADAEFKLSNSEIGYELQVKTDSNGIVNFSNLASGTYTMEEVTAPSGYTKNNTVWEVTVGKETVASEEGTTTKKARVRVKVQGSSEEGTICYEDGETTSYVVNHTRPAVTGTVKIEKVFSGLTQSEIDTLVSSDSSAPENGYYISLGKTGASETESRKLFLSGEPTTDDGKVTYTWTIENLLLRDTEGNNVSYTVTEHNYLLDTYETTVEAKIAENTITVTTDSGAATLTTTLENNNTLTITNTYRGLPLQVKAVDGTTVLSRAKFALYTTSGETETKIGEATTNASGIAEFPSLAFGTYTMKEVEAPSGYVLNDTVWVVTVGKETVTEGESQITKARVRVKVQNNSQDPGTLCYDDGTVNPYMVEHIQTSLVGTVKIQKVFSRLTEEEINTFVRNSYSRSENGYYISLKQENETETESRKLFLSDEGVTRTTNTDGTTSFTWIIQNLQVKNKDGNPVNYTVTEHRYLLDNYAKTEVQAVINGDGRENVPIAVTQNKIAQKAKLASTYFSQAGTDTLTITNCYVGFSLQVKATGRKKQATEGTDSLLSGAVFGLYRLSEGVETEVMRVTTDENGVSDFHNISPGEYIMREITEPTDYIRNTTVWTVTVGNEAVTEEGGTTTTRARVWVSVKNDSPQVERTLCYDEGTITPYVVQHTSVKGKVIIRTKLYGVKEEDEEGKKALEALINNSEAGSPKCYYIHIERKQTKQSVRGAVTPTPDGSANLYLHDATRSGDWYTWEVNDLPLVDSSGNPVTYQITQHNYPLDGYAETVVDAKLTKKDTSTEVGTDPDCTAGRAELDETTFSLDETADTLDISNRYTNEFDLKILDADGEPMEGAEVEIRTPGGDVLFKGAAGAGGMLTITGLMSGGGTLLVEVAGAGAGAYFLLTLTAKMLYNWYRDGTGTAQKEKDPDPEEKTILLKITKKWDIPGGEPPEGTEVRMEVYRQAAGEMTASKYTTVKLNGKREIKPWVGIIEVPAYKGAGNPYQYYVREADLSGYDTKYSRPMVTLSLIYGYGIEAAYCGSAIDTPGFDVDLEVTVTNGRCYLPKTGGEGTTKYTTGGILLIAVSLLYGYTQKHKKQRKRRRL